MKGEELFNCTKCINVNILIYIKNKDIFVCKHDENIINNQDYSYIITSGINSDESDNIFYSLLTESDTSSSNTDEIKNNFSDKESDLSNPISDTDIDTKADSTSVYNKTEDKDSDLTTSTPDIISESIIRSSNSSNSDAYTNIEKKLIT